MLIYDFSLFYSPDSSFFRNCFFEEIAHVEDEEEEEEGRCEMESKKNLRNKLILRN